MEYAIAILQLTDSEETRQLWPHAFTLELSVALSGQRLDMELEVINRGDTSFSFAAALHTYLRVKEVEECSLQGLRDAYARQQWPAPCAPFVDMHDLGDMLVHAGFADPVMDQETLTLRWSDPQALLAELRGLGGNTAPDRMEGLRTPRWQAQLVRELESIAAPDGSIGLSFEVAYGHAFKAAPRLRAGEATTVSLEDMRAMVRSSHGKTGANEGLR